MISSKFLASLAPVMTILVVLSGLWLWLLDPGFTARSAFTTGVLAGFIPTVWLGIIFLQRRRRIGQEARQTLLSSLSLAGALLLAALGLKIAEYYALLDSTMIERSQGIALGIFMMIIGNALPKTLVPLDQKCSSAREQALRRFTGWMFVIAGLGYALAWALLPNSLAGTYAFPALLLPIALVMARLLWVRLVQRRTPA